MLVFHIITGIFALLFGFSALAFRKGAQLHRASGNIFFVSMLLLTASAAILGGNDPYVPILTFYFVITAWAIVLRPEKQVGIFDYLGFLAVTLLSVRFFVDSMSAPSDFLVGLNYYFGGMAALAALLDLNMIVRGGLAGKHRIARHLWRMCYALIGAVASFIANTSNKWPDFIDANIPLYLLAAFMFFWLIRVLFTSWLDKAKTFFAKDPVVGNILLILGYGNTDK